MHASSSPDWRNRRLELAHLRQTILDLGTPRFGPADVATKTAIRNIDDLDRLQRILDAVLTAPRWKDLFDAN